jgi:hypothetical protein
VKKIVTSNVLLENLCGESGPLRREPADTAEIEGLKRSGLRKLADAKKQDLSIESRFDLAYGAAHSLSLAALRLCGYRSSRRDIVFQVLPQTLGLPQPICRVLQKCHDVRNRSEYEGGSEIDAVLLADLLAACAAAAEALDTR